MKTKQKVKARKVDNTEVKKKPRENRYLQILQRIFKKKYSKGATEFSFLREEITKTAESLKIVVPKNIGDVIYSYRYRTDPPEYIAKRTPDGMEWIILPAGKGKYTFALFKKTNINPSAILAETKVLDSTPGIIVNYSMNDEQALLAKIRYNRLIDIFTGVVCYSLQNHLRTTTTEFGQVETDEIYVGIDKRGAHFVMPVQAKSKKDRIGAVQIIQDLVLCSEKFKGAICKPIAARLMEPSLIALFELERMKREIRVVSEKHYRLVTPDKLTPEEIAQYRKRTE